MLPEGIAFASELKALLVLGRPEIDHSAVRDFLFHGYIPAPKTIYRGIAKLPAGHTLDLAGRARPHQTLLGSVDRHHRAQQRRYS